MLGIKVKAKIKTARKSTRPVQELIDTEPLKNRQVRQNFQIELKNRFQSLKVEENIENEWEVVKTAIKETALKVLGKKKKRKRRKWWTEKCQEIVAEKTISQITSRARYRIQRKVRRN